MELAKKDYLLSKTYSKSVRKHIINAFEDFVDKAQGSDGVIGDIFGMLADENIPAYTYELTNATTDLKDACETVVAEEYFVIDPKNFSLDKLLSVAYWYIIDNEFYKCKNEIIFNFCVSILQDKNVNEISEEFENEVENFAKNYDISKTAIQLEEDVINLFNMWNEKDQQKQMEISAEIADLLTCNNSKKSYNNNERLKQQGFLKIEYKVTVKKLNILKVGGYKQC